MANANLSRDLLDDDEVRRLLEACGDEDAGLRDRALIALMVATGVRVSEALSTEPRDVDLRRRRVHIRRGKGGKERHVWVDQGADVPLRAWCEVRQSLGLVRAPLLCSLKGSTLDASYVRRMLPRRADLAGISKRVHAHGLRHSFACNAHRAGISLRSLQLQLGHESISTTSRYLERIGIGEVFEEFDRAFA